ncbi:MULTISPECIES: MSMEG_0569 family flavin-dependent oxidoreductase [unclassified Saccharopolyspora]|uniref:MSMEG_0569 family flavin-dependent oxidoreductase n=1 Tax=unclassified Saccharopolyspora TaxID=2646250 RepID=UPI001CD7A6EE|nr:MULTISPECIES: MSMEG_0569 family flavin-dependent oxidoreductase [unclassified Saccharopolyspora]MCA1186232.1 MSMEG_0569 family flavin-dependent oxidoreductase [Saccharopolyspora sp. 6T]MCA1194632.1 MSMEG_0569 family flavin-dependent oxidoreductase [Saccharopolyspora sp. 6V]MCA1278434.1 MSMEG_0569 family flavin-dependent oxidoreductase [Saccharopolyspora sp. 7B]
MTPRESRYPVVVVGGGQAGLSASYCLRQRGIRHVVLEAERLGHDWRSRRWDSFCLVTPNWQCALPGFEYRGADPDGFMLRDEIVSYLESYAESFGAPVLEGVRVTRLRRSTGGSYLLDTTVGEFIAEQVVVATGAYHDPSRPAAAERIPAGIEQLHSADYRSPSALPAGDVLVVGSGQSGAQIAEDLHLAGRGVHLAVGNAPRVARFYRGRDCVAWLDEMGHYAKTIDEFADPAQVRKRVNHYVTGRDGGRDIDLRTFAGQGMRLYGRLLDIRDGRAAFGDDLKSGLDAADQVMESIKDAIDAHIAARGIDAPTEARYTPVWEPDPATHPRELDLAESGITTVIWSTGFRPDYRWIEVPVFDGRGHLVHRRGVTSAPGLHFLGLPWQHTWGSGRMEGVGRDARYLVERIAASRRITDVCGALTGRSPSRSAVPSPN